MLPQPVFRILAGIVGALLISTMAQAQLAYSPFTEGTGAFIARTGAEINFARGNPAALGFQAENTRFTYSLETSPDHFDSHLQQFGFRLALNQRWTIGIGRWQRTATTGALISTFPHTAPLGWTGFGYRQDWAAGLGFQISTRFAFGIAIRHEACTATPPQRELEVRREYWTTDLGVVYTNSRFNLGLVLRNARRDHAGATASLPITAVLPTGNEFTWNPTEIPGIEFGPEFNTEVGVAWRPFSWLELLGDLSSRAEYAAGLQVKPITALALTAGLGTRYDRIYNAAPVSYAAIGAQYRYRILTGAVTWIAPLRAGDQRMITTQYGTFDQQQMTNHQLLFGLGLAY